MLQHQNTLIPLFFFCVLCVCSSIAEVTQTSQDPHSPLAFASGVSAEDQALHSYSSHPRSSVSRSRTLLSKESADHIWSSDERSVGCLQALMHPTLLTKRPC
ncbi:hypothetical protein GOP47_0030474 [Adiantum capillus-veneris]|nr:hypothetical protein GOP47_0030474 [Adiantum capillus-veneris]